jgi:hypothetical protein
MASPRLYFAGDQISGKESSMGSSTVNSTPLVSDQSKKTDPEIPKAWPDTSA